MTDTTETKVCSVCKQEKDVELFYWSTAERKWRRPDCAKCNMASGRARRGANRLKYRIAHRYTVIKNKYGIDRESLDVLMEMQEHRCAICRVPISLNGEGRAVSVDHDHLCCPGIKSCGRCVRGLLCCHCNSGLGFFDDETRRVEAALEYLRAWESSSNS